MTTAGQCDSFAMPAVTPFLVRRHAHEWNDVNTKCICKSVLFLPKRVLCMYILIMRIYMYSHTRTYCILHVLCSLLLCVYVSWCTWCILCVYCVGTFERPSSVPSTRPRRGCRAVGAPLRPSARLCASALPLRTCRGATSSFVEEPV